MTQNRPTPWWGPLVLLLATALCAAGAASAYQAGDGLQFVFGAGVTAFTALMSWSAFTMREEERQSRG